MEIYKLISYKAGSINVPKRINEELDKEYIKQTCKYLIFSQEDVLELAKDKNELCNEYVKFMDNWKIPFATYYFYGRFNSIMPETINRPNPKLIINSKKGKCDVISQPAYGFLILNIEMLKSKNIKMDDTYPEIFYLQDLAEKCMKEGLWLSNNSFIDIHNSWELFKEHKNNGYAIDIAKFTSEKNRYNQIPRDYKPLQVFIEAFKKYINEDSTTIAITKQHEEGTELIDITKLVEESK